MGIFDSLRCERAFALKRAKAFSAWLCTVLKSISRSTGTEAPSKERYGREIEEEASRELKHGVDVDVPKTTRVEDKRKREQKRPMNIFIFNETIRVTCNMSTWSSNFKQPEAFAYTSCTDLTHPEGHKSLIPSTLNGTFSVGCLEQTRSLLEKVVTDLPCMRSCGNLVDLIMHNAIKATLRPPAEGKKCPPGTLHCKAKFLNITRILDFSRVVTSGFRYLPARNHSLARHAAPDSKCKVGII